MPSMSSSPLLPAVEGTCRECILARRRAP
jgi:hypothetical protein